jgi:undecaprenyl-diphosphatase
MANLKVFSKIKTIIRGISNLKISSAIIQGCVQGLTEFLPISSSGHLAILQYFLGVRENNLLFSIVLHLGTLLALLLVYCRMIFKLVQAFFSLIGRFFHGGQSSRDEKIVINLILSLLPLFLIFLKIPGKNITLKDFASLLAEGPNLLYVGFALLATSFLLFVGSRFIENGVKIKPKRMEDMSAFDSVFIGIAQLAAAVFPGLSRSGSTLAAALMCGIEKCSAIDFSFMMGIPAIIAAAAVELNKVLSTRIQIEVRSMLAGVAISTLVGLVAIHFFKVILKKNKIYIFVLYTLFVGILSMFLGIFH